MPSKLLWHRLVTDIKYVRKNVFYGLRSGLKGNYLPNKLVLSYNLFKTNMYYLL